MAVWVIVLLFHFCPIPIPMLLTFAPLALIIGLAVQLIWEEKPITATVWESGLRQK